MKRLCLTFVMFLGIATLVFAQGVPQGPDYRSLIAVCLAFQLSPTPLPGPGPAPKPGDICPNCNGKGKVGDGTVFVTCQPCKGTGKVLASPTPSPAPQPKPVSPDKWHNGKWWRHHEGNWWYWQENRWVRYGTVSLAPAPVFVPMPAVAPRFSGGG